MIATPAAPSMRQRLLTLQHGLLAASAALLLGLTATVAVTLRSEYHAAVDAILAASDSKAQKLAFRASEVFDRVNQTTLLIKYLHERGTLPPLQSMRAGGVLADDVTRAVMLADRRGFVTDSTTDLVALNIADEDDFKRHRTDAGLDITIAPTARNPLAGGWMIPASRRLNDARGGFAGQVTATVNPAALLAGSVRGEAADTAIGVLGLDGVYRARQVGSAVTFGGKIDPAKTEAAARKIRDTLQPIPSPIDGRARFLSTARVAGYPLLAVIAVNADSALAGYQRSRHQVFAWAGGAALLIVIGSALLWLQIGRLQASRRETRRAEATFRATLEGSMDAVTILRAQRSAQGELLDMTVIDCNGRAAALLGHARDAVMGSALCTLAPSIRSGGFLASFDAVIRSGRAVDAEVQPTEPPLAGRWLHHQLVPLDDGIALITRDVSERKQAERALAELAQRDTLTRLSNRRHFEHRLAEASARALRSGQPLALLYIDLDGFKRVNDTLGHEAGDAVLAGTAQRLLACVRSTDTASRLGGDEFTVILEDAGSSDDLCALGRRIVFALSQAHRIGTQQAVCTPSIGAALLAPGESLASLRHRADAAMYAAKRAGKAQLVLADAPDAMQLQPALA